MTPPTTPDCKQDAPGVICCTDLVRRWEELGKRGVTVSICFGHCGDMGFLYSVDALGPNGQTFDKPFAAESLEQAMHIAEKESNERGWIAPNPERSHEKQSEFR